MGPGEPREPQDEGARRPRDDDENFGYDDPAMNDPEYPSDGRYAADSRARTNVDYADEYVFDDRETAEYQQPVFTEEELQGLGPDAPGVPSGPRRVLPLEDEPTTLVARYLFPTERYRGEWKRHWIHLSTPLAIGAGATLLLGYLAGFLTRQNIDGLVTAAVLIWLAVIFWVAWKV